MILEKRGHRPCAPWGTLLEGNPYSGFPSNDRFALCLLSKEHLAMNSWEDAPWRSGRAGGYSRRPLEEDPMKGSSSKSVRGPPPLWGLQGRCPRFSKITFYRDISHENLCFPRESSESKIFIHISAYLHLSSKLKHARRPQRGFPQVC